MSLHASLMRGWWNKVKPGKPTSDFKADKIPSIFANAESIPSRYGKQTNDLQVATEPNGDYLKKKGFADGFKLPAKLVEAVKKASPINASDPGADTDTPSAEAVEGEPVVLEIHQHPAITHALQNPPYLNNTDEPGNISSPAIVEHVGNIYENAGIDLHLRRTMGGRGGEGANGTKLSLGGTDIRDVGVENYSKLVKVVSVLTHLKDKASGKTAQRIGRDITNVSKVIRALHPEHKAIEDEKAKVLLAVGREVAKRRGNVPVLHKAYTRGGIGEAYEPPPAPPAPDADRLYKLEGQGSLKALTRVKIASIAKGFGIDVSTFAKGKSGLTALRKAVSESPLNVKPPHTASKASDGGGSKPRPKASAGGGGSKPHPKASVGGGGT